MIFLADCFPAGEYHRANPGRHHLPRGGYGGLCFDYEGVNEAVWWQSRGVAGLVLKYRLPTNGYRHPVPLLDIQRAIRLTRSRGGGWKVNPGKVGVMGFSAGGHLAATAATHFDAGNDLAEDPVNRLTCRPDFAILVYPVISMSDELGHRGSRDNLLGPDPDPMLKENLSNETQVTPLTPPTILVHTEEDEPVPIAHSRAMLAALQKAGVRSILHEYPTALTASGTTRIAMSHLPAGCKKWATG